MTQIHIYIFKGKYRKHIFLIKFYIRYVDNDFTLYQLMYEHEAKKSGRTDPLEKSKLKFK